MPALVGRVRRVHCAEVHPFLASLRAYVGAIDESEQDRYLAEQVAARAAARCAR